MLFVLHYLFVHILVDHYVSKQDYSRIFIHQDDLSGDILIEYKEQLYNFVMLILYLGNSQLNDEPLFDKSVLNYVYYSLHPDVLIVKIFVVYYWPSLLIF